jgi:DNA-binding transcriptional MerR regulator
MSKELTISQVAAKVGLSPKIIRYYESYGIIRPLPRQENTYRRFTGRDVERLVLVKRARKLGLPLSEVKNIVSECIEKGCLEARQYVAAKIPGYLKKVEQQIADLQDLKKQLRHLQHHYQKNEQAWQHRSDSCCQIIPIKE